jgi:hypothetical protein
MSMGFPVHPVVAGKDMLEQDFFNDGRGLWIPVHRRIFSVYASITKLARENP